MAVKFNKTSSSFIVSSVVFQIEDNELGDGLGKRSCHNVDMDLLLGVRFLHWRQPEMGSQNAPSKTNFHRNSHRDLFGVRCRTSNLNHTGWWTLDIASFATCDDRWNHKHNNDYRMWIVSLRRTFTRTLDVEYTYLPRSWWHLERLQEADKAHLNAVLIALMLRPVRPSVQGEHCCASSLFTLQLVSTAFTHDCFFAGVLLFQKGESEEAPEPPAATSRWCICHSHGWCSLDAYFWVCWIVRIQIRGYPQQTLSKTLLWISEK